LEKAQDKNQPVDAAPVDNEAKAMIVLGPGQTALGELPVPEAAPSLKQSGACWVTIEDKLRTDNPSLLPAPVPLFKLDERESSGAKIISVTLTNDQNELCSKVTGGEVVNLYIAARAKRKLYLPIIGFQLLDRLGQILCAENSFGAGKKQPFVAKNEALFSAKFTWHLPLLPAGDYVIRAFAAVMTAENNPEILHVIHNALVIHSVTTGARHGLMGIPMLSIRFKYEKAGDTA
jgi:lipopolysaccharide transport system ATP-binding protein